MTTYKQFTSMSEVREANKAAGYHFFDKATIRFFKSRIEAGPFKANYFITSEQFEQEPRRYTIRQAFANGSVMTVGEFQEYETLKEAKAAIKRIQNGEVN